MFPARKLCSAATTCAPSPIAAPTRLIEPARTSPTAKTPGTFDSSAFTAPSAASSQRRVPVTTKPALSSSTPQSASQAVAGSAPTNRKTLRMALVGLGAGRAGCASAPFKPRSGVPLSATISLCGHAARCWASRRCGRSGSATWCAPGRRRAPASCTLAAWPDRKTAAWPAELPPPTSDDLLAARTAALRSARPSTRRRGLRSVRGCRSPAGDSARRSRSPAVARESRAAVGEVQRQRRRRRGCSRAISPRSGSRSRRRISAPARRRGRPAPGRRCRSGSRGSSRSARWRRPGRR